MTFNYGAAWYPEWEPEGEWEKDLLAMRDAGLNTVRICEFSWETIEPQPGEFSFDLYDRVMARCEDLGFAVILGIDTVRPPVWLFELHPDIGFVDQAGRIPPSSWPMHCFNHPAFAEVSAPYIERFVSRYRDSRALACYQLDNEPAYHYRGRHREQDSVYCYCGRCTAAFRRWLEARYRHGRAPRLPTPLPEPEAMGEHLWLEWRRFHDDTNLRRVEWVAAEVKRHDPRHPVTTNIMVRNQFGRDASRYAHDVYRMGALLDVFGMDLYTDVRSDYRALDAMIYSISDRLGGEAGYHCLETQPTTMAVEGGGWATQDRGFRKHGDDRRLIPWGWRPLAFGARSLLYWVWRLQYPNVWALARPDGTVNEFGAQTRRLAAEFARAWPAIEGSRLAASEAAIVHTRDAIHLAARQGMPEAPGEAVFGAFEACWAARILPDVLDESAALAADLSRYRILLAPLLLFASGRLAAALRAYVEAGGTLVWDARSLSYGGDDADLREYSGGNAWKLDMSRSPACGLDEVSGVRVLQCYAGERPELALDRAVGAAAAGSRFAGLAWRDELEGSAEVLARFADGDPALFRHGYGKGTVIVCATDLFRAFHAGEARNGALVRALLEQAGVKPWVAVEGVAGEAASKLEVVLREKGARRYLFALNAHPEAARPTVRLPFEVRSARDLLGERPLPPASPSSLTLELEPYQVAVVELEG